MDLLKLFSLLFTDYTVRNVALGSAIVGAVSGTIGSFALLRKQSLMGDAMSHAALPGIALVFIITGLKTPVALFLGAFGAAWLGAILIIVITRYTRVKEDSSLGIVLAVFFGFGLVLLSWIQRNRGANQAGLDKFLFGRAAAIVEADVIVMAVIATITIILVALFWKEFKLLAFDVDFAASLGFPVRVLDVLLTTLIVMGIVVGLQVVGVVLMAALIVAPAAAARQWTDRLSTMVVISAGFGAFSGAVGALLSSLARGLSTGPIIVLTASAIAIFSLFFAPNRGLIWDWLRQRSNRNRLAQDRVMEALYIMASNHGDPTHPHGLENLAAVLPHYNVKATLEKLGERGLVSMRGKYWSLTDQGVQIVEELQNDTHAAGEGSMLEGKAST
ncbi:MAG: metal ABC transporter permease [Chloroflexi bacterium]|nr:MAG: metal ABC transporter permease [Chloroflexota bacterium]MBL1194792.1 metal ABC transporter permease [Chloroflexota bacterium]NOH12084.1 iron chelate uptake ABC transporter family permease subunit [Chloroflexota bacterium]